MYIDKLHDIVNKYNNIYYNTIKMKPVDIKSNSYMKSNKEIDDNNLNFKLVIWLEYKNEKLLSQKVTFQIGLKKFL